MKHFLLAIILLFAFQADVAAQHFKRMTPQRSHRKNHHRRSHHRAHRSHTYHRTHAVTQAEAPSPYKGDNTPINDGQRKNKQRNLNYNTGQALPASNGR